jgi:acetyltransferase-like isoleucine patch superfamily enzyme
MQNLGDDAAPMVADSAQVASNAIIGEGVKIWDLAQVREHATIGSDSTIGRGAYVDHSVVIGERCKVQNGAQLFSPARVGDGVFVGPCAILANDQYPRAITPDGSLKTAADWKAVGVQLEDGVSLGAGSIVLGGITVGRWATIGAGSTVTHDVVAYALVVGSPARQIGWVGRSGTPLMLDQDGYFLDNATGDRFVERSGHLEEAG